MELEQGLATAAAVAVARVVLWRRPVSCCSHWTTSFKLPEGPVVLVDFIKHSSGLLTAQATIVAENLWQQIAQKALGIVSIA